MSIHTTIARARAAQEKVFLDTCTVTRATGEPVFDPDTGQVITPTVTVYTGRCRVLPADSGADEVQAGETLVGTPDVTVRFPVDTDVRRDDVVTITGSTYDPGMVDKSYTVRKAVNDGRQFARHVVCEEYVVPSEEGS